MWRSVLILGFVLSCAMAGVRPRGLRARPVRPDPASPFRAQSPFSFRAAGIYWSGPEDATARVRASADGLAWTAWRESRGEALGDGRTVSGLLWFENSYRYLEVDGVPDPEILFIDPGAVDRASAPQAAPIDAPPIVPRAQWGCTPDTCPAKDPPLYTTVTHLIVHHTAGANTASDWAAVVRSIWVLHVMGNGWNDIGYNYLIDPNGLLYEGRAGGDGVLGAHFSGVNSGTMGVALLGTYIDVVPPAPMMDMLRSMLAWQADKWHLDVSGESLHAASGLVLNVISGHRDAGLSPKATSTTECPGNAAYSWLPSIREDVARVVSRDCPLDVGERNRCTGAAGGSLTIVVQTPAACSWSIASTPDWIANPAGAQLEIAPNSGARRSATVSIGGEKIVITQSGAGEPDLPCLAMRGIVNSASFDPRPVVAGSQVSLFGQNLAGGSVLVNGKPVAAEFSNDTQINFQLPQSAAIGSAHAAVKVNGIQGPETNFWISEAVPAIFTLDGAHAIAINVDDGTLNDPDHPVQAGHALAVYLTGGGPVDHATPAAVTSTWSAAVGGQPAGKLFLGLAPLLPGIYQANIKVPDNLPPGDQPLVLTVSGVSGSALVSIAGR